jgi:hypothetical protein
MKTTAGKMQAEQDFKTAQQKKEDWEQIQRSTRNILRDKFAMQAMKVYLRQEIHVTNIPQPIPILSYQLADAMVKERENWREETVRNG